MGAGDRDLIKRKEASASSGDDDMKSNETTAAALLLATDPSTAAAGAGKKRKRLVKSRLTQELVDEILTRPVTPFPAIPDELLAGFSEQCRAAFAAQKADAEELMALDADIVRQYKANGYAEVEEEVVTFDDEEEKTVKD